MAELYTYVLRCDTGFAPNPFFGACTLATCKPRIRKRAVAGDWVAGFGSRKDGREGLLVYAMRVEEVLSFDAYWADPRFASKKPNLNGSRKQRAGDNVYHRGSDGAWVQEESLHSRSGCRPDLAHLNRDTSVPRVLVSTSFAYFGADAIEIPREFHDHEGKDYFTSVRGHRRRFPGELRTSFTSWLNSLADLGLAAEPLHSPIRCS